MLRLLGPLGVWRSRTKHTPRMNSSCAVAGLERIWIAFVERHTQFLGPPFAPIPRPQSAALHKVCCTSHARRSTPGKAYAAFRSHVKVLFYLYAVRCGCLVTDRPFWCSALPATSHPAGERGPEPAWCRP